LDYEPFGPRELLWPSDALIGITLNVPAPDADVDLAVAWAEMVTDTRTSLRTMTEHRLPLCALWLIHKNQHAWKAFWAERAETVEQRSWWKVRLLEHEARLAVHLDRLERLYPDENEPELVPA
jgi:hypothetical protein